MVKKADPFDVLYANLSLPRILTHTLHTSLESILGREESSCFVPTETWSLGRWLPWVLSPTLPIKVNEKGAVGGKAGEGSMLHQRVALLHAERGGGGLLWGAGGPLSLLLSPSVLFCWDRG